MRKNRKISILCVILCMAMLSAMVGIPTITYAETGAGNYYENASDFGKDNYPTADGKVFAGWYQDAELQNPVRSDADFNNGGAYAKFVDEKVLTVISVVGRSNNSQREYESALVDCGGFIEV